MQLSNVPGSEVTAVSLDREVPGYLTEWLTKRKFNQMTPLMYLTSTVTLLNSALVRRL